MLQSVADTVRHCACGLSMVLCLFNAKLLGSCILKLLCYVTENEMTVLQVEEKEKLNNDHSDTITRVSFEPCTL